MDDFEFKTIDKSFGVGDRLALFTDGLFEAADSAGEEFGLERLELALARAANLPLDHALESVFQEVTNFSSGAFADDVCIIAAEVDRSAAIAQTVAG